MKILVTGATGFVGAALMRRLSREERFTVRATIRHDGSRHFSEIEVASGMELGGNTDWSQALGDVDVVVHLAARVHVMREVSRDPLTDFRRINVAGTLSLARSAAALGIRRFIFLSSVKVNGEGGVSLPTARSGERRAYRESDAPDPGDAYGISKHEAEIGLRQIAAETGMSVVIIRPPLVYGPGVKANFLTLMRWLQRDIPLPFGAIENRRSLVGLDNLVDLIVICLEHPAAANEIFLVSDGEDLSTPELLRRMGAALGKPARLLAVPPLLLRVGATICGKGDMARRLCGSLPVDISKARSLLHWQPPVSVHDELQQTARSFLADERALKL